MAARPGTPGLLREMNDRTALDLLLSAGPLTRAQLGEHTGLSKVTASQLLTRLEQRHLVEVVGKQSGGRGPAALLYGVVPSAGYVAGLDVEPDAVTACVADLTGATVGHVTVDPSDGDDPVRVVRGAVERAASQGDVSMTQVRAVGIGTPGVVDPRTGDVHFSFDLPAWHDGVLESLRGDLRRRVIIDNDVNLAAVAEQTDGAGRGQDSFALLWVGRGLGLAVVLDGGLHRGLSGGAGEIGYLPVPGAPKVRDVNRPRHAGLQHLVGADAVRTLGGEHGLTGERAADVVAAAVSAGEAGEAFLDAFAERLALGVAAVCVIVDPGLVVLGGEVGRAGGTPLASRVEDQVTHVCPARPRVTPSEITDSPVLRGGVLVALDKARDEVFGGA